MLGSIDGYYLVANIMQATLEPQSESCEGSVTVHLRPMKDGVPDAQDWIFAHLLPRVLAEARQHVGSRNTRYFDAEGIAAEVLGAVLIGAARFELLNNRNDLYGLVRVLVRNKCVDAYRRMLSRRSIEVGESSFTSRVGDQEPLNRFRDLPLARHDIDSLAAETLEMICNSIGALKDDPADCRIVLTKIMEGYSIAEISQIIGRGERYIRRVLDRIRHQLAQTNGISPT